MRSMIIDRTIKQNDDIITIRVPKMSWMKCNHLETLSYLPVPKAGEHSSKTPNKYRDPGFDIVTAAHTYGHSPCKGRVLHFQLRGFDRELRILQPHARMWNNNTEFLWLPMTQWYLIAGHSTSSCYKLPILLFRVAVISHGILIQWRNHESAFSNIILID